MVMDQNADLFVDLNERNYNPMNDVLFKFIFGKEERKQITIDFLKFKLLPQNNPYSMWSIYNPETGDRLNKDLTLHFLEIPKYAKKPVAEMTKMERWLAYFANQLDDNEKEELSMSDTAIKNAMQAARVFLNNTEERRRYINREMAIMDYNSDHEAAIAQGRAEGLAEGERKNQEQTALDMLRDNMDIQLIMKYTHLSAERIAELAKTL